MMVTAGTKKLADYIERRRLTQETFAGLIGCTGPAVSRWTNGVRRPNIDWAFVIQEFTRGAVKVQDWRTPKSVE